MEVRAVIKRMAEQIFEYTQKMSGLGIMSEFPKEKESGEQTITIKKHQSREKELCEPPDNNE